MQANQMYFHNDDAGILRVNLMEATNLPIKSVKNPITTTRVAPFAILAVGESLPTLPSDNDMMESVKYTSKPDFMNFTHPCWNDTFHFHIRHREKDNPLHVKVMIAREADLGDCDIDFSRLKDNTTMDLWVPLVTQSSGSSTEEVPPSTQAEALKPQTLHQSWCRSSVNLASKNPASPRTLSRSKSEGVIPIPKPGRTLPTPCPSPSEPYLHLQLTYFGHPHKQQVGGLRRSVPCVPKK